MDRERDIPKYTVEAFVHHTKEAVNIKKKKKEHWNLGRNMTSLSYHRQCKWCEKSGWTSLLYIDYWLPFLICISKLLLM